MTGGLVAVWAVTADEARRVAREMGIAPSHLLALGNRSADAVRGMWLDRVMILPGAQSAAVENSLLMATRTSRALQWLDLRPLAAAVPR